MPERQETINTPVDDLKIGDWVALVAQKNLRTKYDEDDQFGLFATQSQRQPDFNGRPAKIVAISLPFIAVWYEGSDFNAGIDTVDVRRFELKKLNKHYVKIMKNAPQYHHDQMASLRERKARRKRKSKSNLDSSPLPKCPRCSHPMRKQRLIEPGSGKWVFVCDNCGLQGQGAEL